MLCPELFQDERNSLYQAVVSFISGRPVGYGGLGVGSLIESLYGAIYAVNDELPIEGSYFNLSIPAALASSWSYPKTLLNRCLTVVRPGVGAVGGGAKPRPHAVVCIVISHVVAASNSALTQLCVDGAVGASLVTTQPAHSVRVFETLKSCA